MEKALSISEIRVCISFFLDTPALQACSLVSRTWNQTLAPIFWRNLTCGQHHPTESSSFPSIPLAQSTPEESSLARSSLPSPERLHINQRHIRTLALYNAYAADLEQFAPDGFSQLRSFTFECHNPTLLEDGDVVQEVDELEDQSSLEGVAIVLEANFYWIRKVSVRTVGSKLTGRAWRALGSCRGLEELYVAHVGVKNGAGGGGEEEGQVKDVGWDLLKVLSMVNTLGFDTVDLSPSQAQDLATVEWLPNISRIRTTGPLNPQSQSLLVKCLHLQELELLECDHTFRFLSDNVAEKSGWKDLDSLILHSGTGRELDNLTWVLNAMVPNKLVRLTTLKMITRMGVLGALSRHYGSLVHLDLSSTIPHNTTLQILSSCPHLRFFKGGELSMDNFAEPLSPDQIRIQHNWGLWHNRQPWICHQLEFFEIKLFTRRPTSYSQVRYQLEDGSWSYRTLTQADFDRKEAEEGESPEYPRPLKRHYEAFFTELARLTQLETLLIQHRNQSTGGTGAPMAMDMRLGTGMAILSTLTRLKKLSIQKYCYMDVEDAEWMVKHWKNLEVLDLSPSQGYENREGHFGKHWKAEKVLEVWRQHGIRV